MSGKRISRGERKLPNPYEVAYNNAFPPELAARLFGIDKEKYRKYYDEKIKKVSNAIAELIAISADRNSKVHNADG